VATPDRCVRVWGVIVDRLVGNPWFVIALVALVLAFFYALATLAFRKKKDGDHVTIRLLPPKIEIRGRAEPQTDSAQTELAERPRKWWRTRKQS
jgi:hypothetical protein